MLLYHRRRTKNVTVQWCVPCVSSTSRDQLFACILNIWTVYLRATSDTSILSLLSVGIRMAPAVPTYAPRDPSRTVLYHVIAEHLETSLASCHDDPKATDFPAYVQREFYDYLQCGILAHGFLRLGCDTCHQEMLLPCAITGHAMWRRRPGEYRL